METREFSFGDDSVAGSYDKRLVPVLFDPWANRLVQEHGPWEGLSVLDLATGTGIVAQKLAEAVGPRGVVFGADINGQMLDLARKRCQGTPARFIECPADALGLPDASVDTVVCQQGFQFFPDRVAAALEIYRVLKGNGKVVATTWRPVTECEFFGAVCDALTKIGEHEICQMMRAPFDFVTEHDLADCMSGAGLANVQISRQKDELVINGGIAEALKLAYATPIAPKLRALHEEKQARFRQEFERRLDALSADKVTMGCMVTNVVSAEKPN